MTGNTREKEQQKKFKKTKKKLAFAYEICQHRDSLNGTILI